MVTYTSNKHNSPKRLTTKILLSHFSQFLLLCLFEFVVQLNLNTALAMNETVALTSAEKSRMQNQKQLFVLLKMINFIEKYYSYDKIDSNVYKTEIGRHIERYNRFTQIIPEYNLNNFLAKYDIPHEEVSWAKLVLEKGVHTEENQSKQNFLFVQATANFIKVLDCLNMNEDNPNIGQIRPSLEQLCLILKRVSNKLGNEFTHKFNDFERILQGFVYPKTINESLNASQFREVSLSVQGMYSLMQIILKN